MKWKKTKCEADRRQPFHILSILENNSGPKKEKINSHFEGDQSFIRSEEKN